MLQTSKLIPKYTRLYKINHPRDSARPNRESTEQLAKLRPPNLGTLLYTNYFVLNTTKEWNQLPDDIRQMNGFIRWGPTSFQRAVFEHLGQTPAPIFF